VADRHGRTKSEVAYLVLRRAIVTGEIPGQTPLDESDLIRSYGLGRTPVREALKRLAQEQFIIWGSHRTPYVRDIGVQELMPLYKARELLEVPAARLAAGLSTGNELAVLDRLAVEMDAAYAADQVYEAVELDYQFHGSVADGAHNPFLARAVRSLNEASLRLWFVGIERFPRPPGENDHRDIVKAVRSGDPGQAEAAVRTHIEDSFRRQLILHGLVASTAALEEAAAIPRPSQSIAQTSVGAMSRAGFESKNPTG
jgi:DNA-binding GntR family transcriptional regulator